MKASADGMVVLTGASSGIGLAMAKALLQQGYFVTGISKTSGRETIKSKNFKMVNLDLSRLDSLPDELDKIVAAIDMPIRALINNSGIGKFGSVEQRVQLLNSIKGHVLQLSLQMYGCRVIQKGLEAFSHLPEHQIDIVKELEGHVLKVVQPENYNFNNF